MSLSRVGGAVVALCLLAALSGMTAFGWAATDGKRASGPAARAFAAPAPTKLKPSAIAKQKDGALLIGGRALRCGRNRNVLDRRLPNLGLAAPGVLVFNPRELRQFSDTVRLFVFHHECGHHKVGESELGADCWAVKEGVRDGWLTRDSLDQICRSFGGGPATSTHPSGARRCANLDRCFATAVASLAKAQRIKAKPSAAPIPAAAAPGLPVLVHPPVLRRDGRVADSDDAPGAGPSAPTARD